MENIVKNVNEDSVSDFPADGGMPDVPVVAPMSPVSPVKPTHMTDGAWRNYTEMENGKSYFNDADKTWRTRYGGVVRITDNNGKTLKWQDLDGNETQPDSVKAMQRINNDADLIWNRRAFDQMDQEQRQKTRDRRDGYLADTVMRGLGVLNGGGGEVREINGRKYRAVIYDGLKEGGLDNPVKELNRLKEQMGSRGRMRKMEFLVEVGDDGKPVGGARPRVIYSTAGEDGKPAGGGEIMLGDAMGQWVKKHMADTPNISEGDAKRQAVELFGHNYAGWDMEPTNEQKYNDKQKLEAGESARAQQALDLKQKQIENDYDVALRKLDAQQRQYAESLGFEKAKALGDIYTKLNAGGKAVSPLDIYKSMSDEMKMSYFMDADGNPLSEAETQARFQKLGAIAQAMTGVGNGGGAALGGRAGVGQIDSMINALTNGGMGLPVATAPSDGTGAGAQSPRAAALRAELERKIAAQGAAQAPAEPASTALTQGGGASSAASPAPGGTNATPTPNPPRQVQRTGATVLSEMKGEGVGASDAAPKPLRSNLSDDMENVRRAVAGKRAQKRRDFTSRYKTVQDVAVDVIKTLNNDGALDAIANPDGTRRELTPDEKSLIYHKVKGAFDNAGMSDFWLKQVEGYSAESAGRRLSQDAIIDNLLKDWNNKTSNIVYGNKRKAKSRK